MNLTSLSLAARKNTSADAVCPKISLSATDRIRSPGPKRPTGFAGTTTRANAMSTSAISREYARSEGWPRTHSAPLAEEALEIAIVKNNGRCGLARNPTLVQRDMNQNQAGFVNGGP
jgi:hypothetical protein